MNFTETTDPIAMGRQWLELQKLRTKVKKSVDTNYSRTRRKAQLGLCKYYYKVQATAKHEHEQSQMKCLLIYKTHDLIMVESDVTLQNQQRQTGAR